VSVERIRTVSWTLARRVCRTFLKISSYVASFKKSNQSIQSKNECISKNEVFIGGCARWVRAFKIITPNRHNHHHPVKTPVNTQAAKASVSIKKYRCTSSNYIIIINYIQNLMPRITHLILNLAVGLLSALPVAAFISAFSFPAFSSAQRSKNPAFLNPETPLHYQQTNLYSNALQELEATALKSEWENVLDRDGVVRIDSVLCPDVADALRYSFEDQKILAWFAGMEGAEAAAGRVFYGQKQNEKMCDLQLSMLRGGFAGDNAKNVSDTERHILADVLQDVLGPSGTLTSLCENLVTSEGELYEMAALVTDPGNEVEQEKVQSILPVQGSSDTAPLYCILLALQDVDENMGPMTFFMNTHSSGESPDVPCRISTMKKGDAILFDARISFSSNANDAQNGSTSTMLNISFRNPQVQGDLEYVGSLRPGYRGAMNLGDLTGALLAYGNGDGNAFEKYGDGIRKQFHNIDASLEEHHK
jgi:hypothetical protein